MKRMKRVLALGMAVLMCMGLTACGKDFDAAGYTKSVLDANYHAQYDNMPNTVEFLRVMRKKK